MSFNLSKPNRQITAAVLLMNGVTEILDVAPMDLLSSLSRQFIEFMPFPDSVKDLALDVDMHWVNENGDDARLTTNATIKCTHSFATCPPVDIVLMGAANSGYVPNDNEIAFIRKAYEQCSAFIMICGGFRPLMHAGLMTGKTATAPRFRIKELRKSNPEVNWVERRWAHDGKMWTSGALLNGLDLMMAFARETWGNELLEYMLKLGSWPVRDIQYPDTDGSAPPYAIA